MQPVIMHLWPDWGSPTRKQLVSKMLGALHPGFDFVLHEWPVVELEVRHQKSGLRVKTEVGELSVFREAKKYVQLLQEEVCYRGD